MPNKKANTERLREIQRIAKKLREKDSGLKQTEAVKKAWEIYKKKN